MIRILQLQSFSFQGYLVIFTRKLNEYTLTQATRAQLDFILNNFVLFLRIIQFFNLFSTL